MKKIIYISLISLFAMACDSNQSKCENADTIQVLTLDERNDNNPKVEDSIVLPKEDNLLQYKDSIANFSDEELLSFFLEIAKRSEVYHEWYDLADLSQLVIGVLLDSKPDIGKNENYSFSIYESYPDRILQTLHFEFDPNAMELYYYDIIQDKLVKQSLDEETY